MTHKYYKYLLKIKTVGRTHMLGNGKAIIVPLVTTAILLLVLVHTIRFLGSSNLLSHKSFRDSHNKEDHC